MGDPGSKIAGKVLITVPGPLKICSAKLVGWWLKACLLEPEGLGSNPDSVALQLFDLGEVT